MSSRLDECQVVILTDYRGLSVADMQRLRSALGPRQVEYTVIKNRLLRRALEASGWPVPEDLLTGPTAVALVGEDLSGTTQKLLDFARQSGILAIKGGLLPQRALDAAEVGELAKLPPREEIQATILSGLVQPMAALVSVLGAPAAELQRTVRALPREVAGTLAARGQSA
jgi:large subunit ribosomal protein L10